MDGRKTLVLLFCFIGAYILNMSGWALYQGGLDEIQKNDFFLMVFPTTLLAFIFFGIYLARLLMRSGDEDQN